MPTGTYSSPQGWEEAECEAVGKKSSAVLRALEQGQLPRAQLCKALDEPAAAERHWSAVVACASIPAL